MPYTLMQICPYCESELSDTAKKCKFCWERVKKENKTIKSNVTKKSTANKKKIAEPLEEENYYHTNAYDIDFEWVREYAKQVDKMCFNNSFIWKALAKIKACWLFLWIIVLLWISMIIPALIMVIKRGDPWALFLMPIGLVISIWLFWRDKFLNTILLLWTIAITISARHY